MSGPRVGASEAEDEVPVLVGELSSLDLRRLQRYHVQVLVVVLVLALAVLLLPSEGVLWTLVKLVFGLPLLGVAFIRLTMLNGVAGELNRRRGVSLGRPVEPARLPGEAPPGE